MKFQYEETTDDLAIRIDIHNKFGGKDIDEWMLNILPLSEGNRILDVGCGAGKQCFSYHDHLKGICDITGGDVSKDMIDEAAKLAEDSQRDVKFMELNFNEKFPFDDNQFDLLSCCFAIYYAEDIPFTISEMHRVLKPGGKLFTSGPMPENKQVFYDVIKEATGKTIPPMPGSSRYASEIYASIETLFTSVDTHIFENPLTFKTAQPFIDYTRASLSEDRKLWSSFFQTKDDFSNIMQAITEVSEKYINEHGELVMTKVVGGFIATK